MNDCPSYYPDNMYSSSLMKDFCDSLIRREVLMNFKRYCEEVKKAEDSYYHVWREIVNLETEQEFTDYHISLCRELLRVAILVRTLESVDIPVKEDGLNAEF